MPDLATVERPWVAAYPPGVPDRYAIPAVGLGRLLQDAARDFPRKPAMVHLGTTTTWHELGLRVAHFAAVLQQAGVAPGDRVVVVLANVPSMVATCFAVWRCGATVVPVPPAATAASEAFAATTIQATSARWLVGSLDEVDRLALLRDRALQVQGVFVTDLEAWLAPRSRLARRLPRPGRRSSWRPSDLRGVTVPDGVTVLETSLPGGPASPVSDDPSATAVVLFTAGATGARKGVLLSHANLVANAFQARLWLPDLRAGEERILCVLPFSHAYGLTSGMLTATLTGACMVLPDDTDAGALLGLIATQRPTLVAGAPSLFAALARHAQVAAHDLSSVRACLSGAATLPDDVVLAFEEASGGARLREGYGLTEAGPLTHANPVYGRTVSGAIGLPVTETVAIVVDPANPTRRRSPGEVGELAVHGPQVMQGYLDDPQATAQVLRDGWLLTGDLVTCDDEGVFHLVGRTRAVVHSTTGNGQERRA